MLWIKALHIISIIAWFSGLFYLPRLIICYYQWCDAESRHYLPIMATKLYHYIMNPAALCSLGCGWLLVSANLAYYCHQSWLQLKIGVVICLLIYHGYLGRIVAKLRSTTSTRHRWYFYRMLNFVPSICCIVIITLSVVQSNGG